MIYRINHILFGCLKCKHLQKAFRYNTNSIGNGKIKDGGYR